jgi:hypothetical protein
MTADTPFKKDGLARPKESAGMKASPALRSGTPRTHRGSPRHIRTSAEKRDPVTSNTPAERVESKSLEQNDGNTQPQPNGYAPEKVNPGEDAAIDVFIDHCVDTDNSTVSIKVKWEDGETTWESEWSLQEQVPTLVFKYWEKLGGREAATNLDIYHVFKILKRTTLPGKSKGAQDRYQVQWVGYRQAESTWEKESKLRTIAPGELEKFEAKQLASGASEKRKSTRGPGRPRKKPRVED